MYKCGAPPIGQREVAAAAAGEETCGCNMNERNHVIEGSFILCCYVLLIQSLYFIHV